MGVGAYFTACSVSSRFLCMEDTAVKWLRTGPPASLMTLLEKDLQSQEGQCDASAAQLFTIPN